MARYFTEEEARADGFTIVHDPERQEFVLRRDDSSVGVAHYALLGSDANGDPTTIDFDHTLVEPELRGTGLSNVLARRALGDDVVRGKQLRTSCWFIEGVVTKHPEYVAGAN